jgi:glycine cleavage system T protein
MPVVIHKTVSKFVPSESLEKIDPQIHQMIRKEVERQGRKIVMIASESICPRAVLEALASDFNNIYAEGYPSPRTFFEPAARLSSFQHQLTHYRRYSNRRYYKGTEYVDVLESTIRRRAAEVFANDRVKPEEIFANVQPLSGAAANNAVYNAFVKPGETVLGPSLTHGGHLTHGSEVNRSGMSFSVVPYEVSRSGKLDYDRIEKIATGCRPKLIIGGFSAYPWDVDWARLREIADKTGAVLLADIAHLAGMVAAGLLNNPVGHAHVVSFTTHKTLCGPRGAMLLSTDPEVARRVDLGVFPGEQGGPHIHQMAAKAVAMQIAGSGKFKKLQKGVLENAAALAEAFSQIGFELAYGGTNTHMCLIDLRKVETPTGQPLTGEIASRILDLCGIVCNKNTIFGDTNAIHPSGLRFGATWVTQLGFGPEHMLHLAKLIGRVLINIHPFSYIGGQIDWGRGKVDPSLVEEVNAEVRTLLEDATGGATPADSGYPHFPPPTQNAPRSTPLASLHKSQAVKMKEQEGWVVPQDYGDVEREVQALKEGAALIDDGGTLLVGVGPGRAGQLLECACTSPILSLEEGRCVATQILTPQGQLGARALVLRLPPDRDGYDRFLMKIRTAAPDKILLWLRGLSDGYLFHDEDLWLKCEGPAVVEDLAGPSDETGAITCLGLRGPKAAGALQDAGYASPAPGEAVEADGMWILGRPEGVTKGFDLFVPVVKATAVWSRLLEAGVQPAGDDAVSQVFDRPPDSVSVDQRVNLTKPFFVGQKALMKSKDPVEPPPAFEWKPDDDPIQAPEQQGRLRETCLIKEHQKLCKPKHLVEFAGWRMPVMYSGILDEHAAVRTRAGVFDVSHMGLLDFRGPYAERFLDLLTTNYVPMLVPGQAHYSYLLAHDGRCIDDIIVYRLARDHFMMVVNAANAEEDEAWFRLAAGGKVLLDPDHPGVNVTGDLTIRNLKDPQHGQDCRVDLALQGPRSLDLFDKLTDSRSARLDIERLRRFELVRVKLSGLDTIVARTGYTGEEIGFEIFVHPDPAPRLWNTLLDGGRDLGVSPAGLGARDSLRCEAGFPLHGHELAGPHEVSPIEAGYGSYVKLHKPFFPGRRLCLEGHRERRRTVVRFEVNQKGGKVLRAGNPVLAGRKNEYAGRVTSATATPNRQVGMALIDSKYAKVGARLQILPIADSDKPPPSRTPLQLEPGDWMTIPRQATILPRLMRPGEENFSS